MVYAVLVLTACYQTLPLLHWYKLCYVREPCGLLWSSAGAEEGSGEEGQDRNWHQNCQAALNGLTESFTTSMQAYTQGEHEQYRERELPPHAHAHNGHHLPPRSVTAATSGTGRGSLTNLIKSKGMSKVSKQYNTVYTYVHVYKWQHSLDIMTPT